MFLRNKKYTYIGVTLLLSGVLFVVFFYALSRKESASGADMLALVADVPQEPEVVEVGTDLLGKAELSYAGGTEGRNKNIELGAGKLDGTIISPGDEFSFTQALGAVTVEGGYSEERIFLNGEVTKGLGGGLCQVSTTLFRSVLDAGFPVTERHNHSYTVSRYDVGLDATYADPGPDFKFVNDSKYPVVLKSRTENQKVIFELYGTYDGRVASTTEPEILSIVDFPPTRYVATSTPLRGGQECFNTPQIGYTAKVLYSVLYPNGLIKQQDFISKYKPLQRVCLIGPLL